MKRTALLRSEVEAALAGRVAAPFTYRDRKVVESVSTGIPEIDLLAGGLPRGSLTEICGPPCSGHMSVLLAALAARTAQPEACALVDGRDAFDPQCAEAAGVRLKHLLWVRCGNIDHALRAADLLLQGGGFGLVALDLSDIPPETVRHVPLHAWFRFRRTVENTPTILLLLEQEANAKTCASVVLRLGMNAALWSATAEEKAGGPEGIAHPWATLLDGFEVRAELVRSRVTPVTDISIGRGAPQWTGGADGTAGGTADKWEGAFEARAVWSRPGIAFAGPEPGQLHR
jgi:recombination protein RecA